ncbi:ribose-5-phosphate isomerase [Saccharopolyspora sp. TS4A08]|uniref:Ribose-5-phosphate isomerase B n=1 Tax=Saccharopolyspora ipomoeae TaxID=3042027 RepID=A0ABT6PS24_9PSEU|nr:ribose-5-phosphate isomerase [Saccharopolyspora sp. TS4A08]MDI2030443.1 ribose-5-phosphate isomerase [Saccharopolyspora sp. TS4A08]
MRVYLGSDHAGFELKSHLVKKLADRGYETIDVGPATYDPSDDYPPFCIHAAWQVVADQGSLGVVIGGSGNGEQIAANKVPGARAALVWNAHVARLARRHNNALLAAIGARLHALTEAELIVDTFLSTEFEGGRHQRRLDQLAHYETSGELPPLRAD